jgi:NADH-quinone oxidoreductase subunit A
MDFALYFILNMFPWIMASFQYYNFFIYFVLLCLIAFIMLGVSRLLVYVFLQDTEKISEYECGFEPFDSATRQPFDVHFYLVGLLFLIFDVELVLLFPASIYMFSLTWFNAWFIIFFLFVLFIGLIYE